MPSNLKIKICKSDTRYQREMEIYQREMEKGNGDMQYAFRDMHAQSEIKMPKARLKCVGDMQAFRDLNTPDMQAVKEIKMRHLTAVDRFRRIYGYVG